MYRIFQPTIWLDYSGGVRKWDEMMEKESDEPTAVVVVAEREVWSVVMVSIFADNVSEILLQNWDSRSTSEVKKRCNLTLRTRNSSAQ